MLLCLLAPAVPLALTGTTRRLLAATALSGAVLAVAGAAHGVPDDSDYALAAVQWLLLAVALGLALSWAVRLTPGADPYQDDLVQVRLLLQQLRSLTRHLPGSLDAVGTAEALLDRCAKAVTCDRAAVVVRPTGSAFVPLAVRGAQRVPWRDPLEQDGPLRQAWESGQPVLDRRSPDTAGRRRGSCVLAVPLVSAGSSFGLVILESHDLAGFSDDVVAAVREQVRATSDQLETALLFDEVQMQATVDERDRLAREMHDGIAQELASLGYRLDNLQARAATADADLAAEVAEVREELSTLIADLRLSITSLRSSVRHDRGLGAALGTYLRAVSSGRALVLTLQLEETAFRLPAEQEVALLRAAQAFAQDVRRDRAATALAVHLVVDPPSALLSMSCTGGQFAVDLGDAGQALVALGASVTTSGGQAPPSLSVELRRSVP